VHVNCFQFCLPVKTEVNVQRRFIKVEWHDWLWRVLDNEGQNTNSTANQMQNIYTSRITVGSTNIVM
jgi:hypothetical protein